MDCSSITDFQQSTAIRIAKKFRNLHIGIAELQIEINWLKFDYLDSTRRRIGPDTDTHTDTQV